MHQNTIFVATVLVSCASWCSAAEPDGLVQARNQFIQRANPTEADRQNYRLELSRLRASLAEYLGSDDCFKVDAEVRRHRASENAEGYSKLMAGKWSSPRHEYIYRSDGTWSMPPEEEGATRGRWRIAGNQFFSNADIEVEDSRAYAILLLTKDNFIFTDGDTVFYEELICDHAGQDSPR